MVNRVDIDALKKNFDPRKGPQTVDEWIYLGGNSPNVLNNIVVSNARLASTIARALNNHKDLVDEITDMIDAVSQLKTDIYSFKPADPDFTKTGTLGKTIEEARQLYERIKAQIDLKPTQRDKIEQALAKNEIPSLDNKDYQIISDQLQTRVESLTTISQKESVRLQTLTNRFTQANEQAGTVQQKDAQSKEKASTNLRGG